MLYTLILLYIIICIIHFDVKANVRYKYTCYFFLLFILVLLSTIAYRMGTDANTYQYDYQYIKPISNISLDYLFEFNKYQPGYVLFLTFCKTISPSYYFFKFIYSIIVNGAIFYFINKNTRYVFLAVFSYAIGSYMYFNFEIFREGVAVAMFLLSLKYYFKHQWVKYFLISLLAFSFHSSAALLFLLPLFSKFKINNKTLLLSICVFSVLIIASSMVKPLVEQTLALFESFNENYSSYLSSEKYGESTLSISRLFNYAMNILFPLFMLRQFIKTNSLKPYYVFILISIGIYIVSQIIPIFYRFNNYFRLFSIIFYIDIFRYLSYSFRQKNLMFIALSICYILLSLRPYFAEIDDTGIQSFHRYYPYSSIIDKTRYSEREFLFNY